ncbi:DoxX-like family protein [Acidovorax temperans]|uniref:DoxX-like family protein n=1 Tax=Acidovorax temperans TaxID=80878 RepID=UPI0035B42A58
MAYATALAVMIGMTLAATAIDPSWWLHPLGPQTKNLPIAAILWVLWRASPASPARHTAPSPTRQPS